MARSFSKNVGPAAPGGVACLEKNGAPPPPIDHPRQGRGSRPRTAGALMSRFETGNLLLCAKHCSSLPELWALVMTRRAAITLSSGDGRSRPDSVPGAAHKP